MDKRFALVVLALICLRFSKITVIVVLLFTFMLLTRRQLREPQRVECEPLPPREAPTAVKHSLSTTDKCDKAFRGLAHEVVAKYIRNWFKKLSQDPTFPNSIETSLESVFAKLVDRGRMINWQVFLSCKCLPVVVKHFSEYVTISEKVLSQKKLSKSRDKGLKLNGSHLASMYEYLHPGITGSDREEALVYGIAEMLVEPDLLAFQPVKNILTDIARNVVLEPALNTLCDSDFLNLKLIAYAERQLSDAEKVNRMRRIIQQSLTAGHFLPRISSDSHPAEHERFLQEVSSIKSKDVAKQLESSVDAQLKALEGAAYKPANVLLKRRLEEGKRAIEKRIKELSPQPPPQPTDSGVQDLLTDSKLSYAFQQYMAGLHDGRFQLYLDIIEVHKRVIDPMGDVDVTKHLTREDVIKAKGVCRRVLFANFKSDAQAKRTINTFVESDHVSHDLFLDTERALWNVKDDLAKEVEACLERFKISPNYAKYLESQVNVGTELVTLTHDSVSDLDNASRKSLSGAVKSILDSECTFEKSPDSDEDSISSEDELSSSREATLKINYEERLRQVIVDIDQLEGQMALVDKLLTKAQSNGDEHEISVFQQSRDALERELKRKNSLKTRFLERLRTQQLYNKVKLSVERWATFNDGAGEYTTYLVDVKHCDDSESGWVIPRRFSQFYELRKILKKEFPEVGDIEFPSRRMMLKFQQRHFVETRMASLNQFMNEICKSEAICNHLVFRMFLSSYHFPQSYYEVAQASAIMGSGSLPKGQEYTSAVDSVCGAFLTLFNIDQKTDWIKGKAIVTVVHQILGNTIDKRINEAMSNMVDQIPHGVNMVTSRLANDEPVIEEQRTAADKLKAREQADELCYRLIRHYFAPVIGPARARYCKTILVQIIQNEKLNRHLLLSLLELLVQELLLVEPTPTPPAEPVT